MAALRRPVRMVVLSTAVAAVLLAGCAKFDAALGQSWVTVSFKPGTPLSTLLMVRAACSRIPNIQAEPLPRRSGEEVAYGLTFRTDKASDANLANLQLCVQKFPAVIGLQQGDSGDAG